MRFVTFCNKTIYLPREYLKYRFFDVYENYVTYICPVCGERHIYNSRLDKYHQKWNVINLVKKESWNKIKGQNPVFRPTRKGESIEGEVLDKRQGQYGSVLDLKDSKNKVWTVFSTKLMEQLISSVNVGDSVKIVYQGKIKLKNNREAHSWEVYKKSAVSAA
jgi:predicted RNA-binding Zn-ribbon protein involved in translation (DUF1610 family)